MPDDWAKKFVENYNQEHLGKQQKEQEAQARRSLANAGAHERFHRIREHVRLDVETLKEAVGFASVEWDIPSDREFIVTYRGALRLELKVSFSDIMIVCNYDYTPKGSPAKKESVTLRICSDLDGVLTVSESNGEKTFAYDSEVSEFILRPVITHIISQ
jgi:hypothetical protein